MAQNDQTTPPPEALLLRAARESRRPRKLSMRAAARRADVSETTWRHVEAGSEPRGNMRFPYRAGAATLARMALAVGLTAERLDNAGRPDAGAVVREMLLPRAEPPSAGEDGRRYDDPHLQAIWDDGRLPEDVRLGMIRLAQKALRQPGESRPPNGGAA